MSNVHPAALFKSLLVENAPWLPSCCIQVPTKLANIPMRQDQRHAWENGRVII